MINTDEMIGIALSYFYDDESFLDAVRSSACAFNMMLSYLYAYNSYIQSFNEFFVNIGRSRMRENLRNEVIVRKNLAFSTSLFNIVDSNDIASCVNNDNEIRGIRTKLAKLLIEVAKPLCKKLYISVDPMLQESFEQR